MILTALVFASQLAQANIELPPERANPHTSPADIETGKKLFAGRCAGCHGPNGDGGKGANLASATLPRAHDDITLYKVIRYGIPETEMPRQLMTPREVWQIAAFVRTLGRVAVEPVSGDANRGRGLFESKGCLQCHAIGMDGGRFGPPLEEIGKRRNASHLRRKIVDPAADVPEKFRAVELATNEGKKLSGVRLNEDTWSIQLRDASGKIHSFWKSDLAQLKSERRSLMPAYGTQLQPREIEDLVAYLITLKGTQ